MSFEDLRLQILSRSIVGSDGSHSARLWRVAENIRDEAIRDGDDDRMLHLMSRVGVLCRGMAKDLRSGHISPEDVATLLDQLADIGHVSFKLWSNSSES